VMAQVVYRGLQRIAQHYEGQANRIWEGSCGGLPAGGSR
jgi:hypothetical protein